MRRRCDRYFGLGPLFFDGEGGGAPGDGGGAPAPTPPAPTPQPTPNPPDPGALPSGERSDMITRSRFDEVIAENRRMKEAEEERTRQELEKKGEHEKIAEQEKAKRLEAEQRVITVARRSAFIGAAAGKVADPEAAYKLASADGLLNDLAIDDDGNAKDEKAPAKIVDDVVKRYEFLKATNGTGRGYGGDRSGAGGAPELPQNASSREILSAAYANGPDPRRPR